MPTPTYDNSTDGELIVKASAMFAAFNAYHQKYLQDKTAVMHYRGSVANMTALYALLDDPNVNLTDGDVYNVIATGENFAYATPTGSGTHEDADYWDNLGSVVDLTGYATETWVNNKFANDVSFGGNVSVAGTLSSTGNISSSGEVSATETVGGQTVTHNLTDKLDTDDYQAAYTWGEASSKFTWDSIKGGHSTAQDTYTPNLNLVKPGLGTQIDVTDLNNNFDILDANAKVRVDTGSGTSVSVNQLSFLDNANSIWKYLDEVRLYNGTDALYCKTGVTTGLLMQDNQIKVVNVAWNNGVPAVGTLKGYISADGDYHIWDATANSGAGADSTSLATLRDSVSRKTSGDWSYRIIGGTAECWCRVQVTAGSQKTDNIFTKIFPSIFASDPVANVAIGPTSDPSCHVTRVWASNDSHEVGFYYQLEYGMNKAMVVHIHIIGTAAQ